MGTLEIGICDDDGVFLNIMKGLLRQELFCNSNNQRKASIRCFTVGRELLESGESIPFDLVFLDIEMYGKSGFEVAQILKSKNPEAAVIFISSHEGYVFESYEFEPLWFVRKNNLQKDISKALKKYFQKTVSKKIYYKINEGFGTRNIYLKDILYFECDKHNISIYTSHEIYHTYGSLKKIEEELAEYQFFRIHKNYLVNQNYIRHIKLRSVVLSNGVELDMSKNKKSNLDERMADYARRL